MLAQALIRMVRETDTYLRIALMGVLTVVNESNSDDYNE
jgi:hypothetical protein